MRSRVLFQIIGLGILLAFGSCAGKQESEIKVVRTFYKDGQPKKAEFYQINEVGDSILKRSEDYYISGSIYIKGSYNEDKLPEGYWAGWREDSTLWSETEFVEGKEHGIKKVYHPNGQLYFEGRFDHGKKIGPWKFYSETGELLKEIEY